MKTSALTAAGHHLADMIFMGAHKPAENDDRKTIHRAEIEVSPKDQPFNSEAFAPSASAGSRSFFEILPRELRDAIYEHTFEHVVKHQNPDGDVTLHFHAPVSNLRLVSRQFTTEYDERFESMWADGSTLSLVNNSYNSNMGWNGTCPRLATRCRALKTTRALLEGCDHTISCILKNKMKKLLTHRDDTSALAAALPNLRRVDVIYSCESLCSTSRPEYFLRFVTEFHKLEIFHPFTAEGSYELRYQGLTYPLPRNLRELDVPNIHVLDAPITLAIWTPTSQSVQISGRDLVRRRRVEAMVYEAWQAVHGCTLWESQQVLREKLSTAAARPKRVSPAWIVLRALVCGYTKGGK